MATSQGEQNVESFEIGLLDYDPEEGGYYTRSRHYFFQGTLEEAEDYACRIIDGSSVTEMGARIWKRKAGGKEVVLEFWYDGHRYDY